MTRAEQFKGRLDQIAGRLQEIATELRELIRFPTLVDPIGWREFQSEAGAKLEEEHRLLIDEHRRLEREYERAQGTEARSHRAK